MKRFALIGLLLLAGCTRPDHARHLLEQQGYKNIEITGYSWFSCGKDDSIHTGFRATAPNGTAISGTVCEGLLFKNATVRFE